MYWSLKLASQFQIHVQIRNTSLLVAVDAAVQAAFTRKPCAHVKNLPPDRFPNLSCVESFCCSYSAVCLIQALLILKSFKFRQVITVSAKPVVFPFAFMGNSQLEHLIIRTNLLGPREFELSGLYCILYLLNTQIKQI